jgi:hypothetical protein
VSPEPEPVLVFHESEVVSGFVEPAPERLSDVLNSVETLRVRAATEEGTPGGDPAEVPVDEIVLLAPPPRASDPARRVARSRRRVALHVGPYHVVGTAHLPPGTEMEAFIAEKPQRFMALTDCRVLIREVEYTPEVVIVNLARVIEVEHLITVA